MSLFYYNVLYYPIILFSVTHKALHYAWMSSSPISHCIKIEKKPFYYYLYSHFLFDVEPKWGSTCITTQTHKTIFHSDFRTANGILVIIFIVIPFVTDPLLFLLMLLRFYNFITLYSHSFCGIFATLFHPILYCLKNTFYLQHNVPLLHFNISSLLFSFLEQ